MPVYLGGAELNVATALAGWNLPVKYITALPEHYLSREIIQHLSQKNVDTASIYISGNRIGTYYIPQGADLKSAGVIYDRAGSSFSSLTTGTINWNETLEDCSWFHCTAINPALNEEAAAVCVEAIQTASEKGLTISIDLNYRSKLWQYGQQPATVMPQLVQYADVLMGNIWAAEQLLGIPSPVKESTGKTKEELVAAAETVFGLVQQQYPKIKTQAFTFRLEEEYFSVAKQEEQIAVSATFPLNNIIDKAGSGDCFMAGLIYGLEHKHPLQEIINYSSAAAVGKMQEKGDATAQSITDIQKRVSENE